MTNLIRLNMLTIALPKDVPADAWPVATCVVKSPSVPAAVAAESLAFECQSGSAGTFMPPPALTSQRRRLGDLRCRNLARIKDERTRR